MTKPKKEPSMFDNLFPDVDHHLLTDDDLDAQEADQADYVREALTGLPARPGTRR